MRYREPDLLSALVRNADEMDDEVNANKAVTPQWVIPHSRRTTTTITTVISIITTTTNLSACWASWRRQRGR
jgi:hypothetical protein